MATPPDRSRLLPMLLFVGFCVLCFVVPRLFYSVRVAMLEMRYSGLIFLLCAVFIWILIKAGPKNKD